MCDKRFIWNPSNCECDCDKSPDAGKYLSNENCTSWRMYWKDTRNKASWKTLDKNEKCIGCYFGYFSYFYNKR